jgi:hypothetical protein
LPVFGIPMVLRLSTKVRKGDWQHNAFDSIWKVVVLNVSSMPSSIRIMALDQLCDIWSKQLSPSS